MIVLGIETSCDETAAAVVRDDGAGRGVVLADMVRSQLAEQDVNPDFIARQMSVVLDDIGADCIKTGMLHREDVIQAVVGVLEAKAAHLPLVVDPVMYAKGGAALLAPTASEVLKERLIPRATVLTPNLPEAEFLTDARIASAGDMDRVAAMLLALGPKSVLLKGRQYRHSRRRQARQGIFPADTGRLLR